LTATYAETVADPGPQVVARSIADELADGGLVLRTGPFVYRIRSDAPAVAKELGWLYADHPRAPAGSFVDFDVEVRRSRGWRRWLRAQSRFQFEGTQSFEPLPMAHAFALLEWGMNWCISSNVNHHLLIHSAVVERGGRAAILPAPPGSGKSTLCAALVHRGWRLLSDEIAVVPLDASGLLPLARPVGLKNASIDVIAQFEPRARFSRRAIGTSKGTVSHMQVPRGQVRLMDVPAPAAWVVFPRWRAGAEARLSPRTRAQTLVELAGNSFNAATLGLTGFHRLGDLVDGCDCYNFEYGELDDAIGVFDALAGGKGHEL
jgi:HprK-related kinase A